MAVVINNIDDKYFELNGVRYVKIYQPLKQGVNLIGIYNTNDTSQQLVSSTVFSDYIVDSIVYSDVETTIQKILEVVYEFKLAGDVSSLIENKTDSGGYQGTTQSLKEELDNKAFLGLRTYQTLANLNAVNPVPSNGTAAKVANDSTLSNNGFYSVSAGVWVKDEELVAESVDIENTSQGVSSRGFVEYNSERESKWFVRVLPASPDYLEREFVMLKGIKMFYSTSDDFRISIFGKGETTFDKSIGVAQISTGDSFLLYRGSGDSGRRVYQGVFKGESILIDVDWDEIPDLAGWYVSTNKIRFVPTTTLQEEYKGLIADNYSSSNIAFQDNVIISDDEIRYRSVNASTIEIRKTGITIPNERIDVKFYIDPLTENGCTLGYRDDTNSRRFLFGYEPAFNAIVVFTEDGSFTNVIEGGELKTGYVSIGIEYLDGELIGYFEDRSFRISEYTNHDISLVNHRRMNIKVKNSDFSIKDYKYTKKQSSGSIFNQYSSNVHVYKTGLSDGDVNYNDWCFVRTPTNYDPQRKRPYPFVIGNHGNSWVMDGTEEKANYASITQWGVDTQNGGAYLNTGAAYYKEFSNETIERLLEAGYVVCGTQNYGQAEYGSDPGRNALQDFFYHMRQNWNVEEKCFMIGASNGAMMSLNGSFLLGIQNIKAMVLQYPLSCLFRHYKGYAPHQTAINTIYGLSGTETDSELHIAFNDHDPEYANSVEVSGLRYKTNLFPPMKIWYSEADTVTDADNNAKPLIDLIERSNGKVESVVATGQHGDYTHVDAVSILSFFNKYL